MLGAGLFNPLATVNVWSNDSAIFFDGVNDRALIELPQAANEMLRNNFTLSLWVVPRTATFSSDFIIWYHEETSPTLANNAFQYLWYDESEEKFKFTRTDTNGDNPETSEYPIAKSKLTEWHHVVVSVSGNGLMRLFINSAEDGDETADNPGNWTASPSNMYYGVNGASNDKFFNGYINNVAIWNEPFGGTQVVDIYNEGEPKNELYSYDFSQLFFYHVSNEKTFISDTGYQVATFGVSDTIEQVSYSGAIVVSNPY